MSGWFPSSASMLRRGAWVLNNLFSVSSLSFFDMDIVTLIWSKRAICFDKRWYNLFQEFDESPMHCISMKRPRHSGNDFSKTKEVKVDYTIVQKLEIIPIKEALSEKKCLNVFVWFDQHFCCKIASEWRWFDFKFA